MKLSDLVVSRASAPQARAESRSQPRGGEEGKGEGEGKAGAFITPQSLVSFPVATVVVIGLSKVVGRFWTKMPDGAENYIILGLSLLVGLVIFLLTTTDEAARPKGARGWIVAVIIAIFNSGLLAGAALGVPELINGTNG